MKSSSHLENLKSVLDSKIKKREKNDITGVSL